MYRLGIGIRKGKVVLYHLQGGVSQNPLQGEHVSAVAEVKNGERVPEAVRGEHLELRHVRLAWSANGAN